MSCAGAYDDGTNLVNRDPANFGYSKCTAPTDYTDDMLTAKKIITTGSLVSGNIVC